MHPTSRFSSAFFIFPILLASAGLHLANPPRVECAGPRYPSDFAMGPQNRFIFTANRGSGTITALDLSSGKVVQELKLAPGALPARVVAYKRKGSLEVALSDEAMHCVRIFTWAPDNPAPLRPAKAIPVGRLPRGLAYDPPVSYTHLTLPTKA